MITLETTCRRWFSLLAWLPCLLLMSCVPSQGSVPLVIGINSWPGYEFARLAREKGYYQDEGVQVKLVELPSLSDSRRAYERGQLDGMFSTVVEVLQAKQHGERQPVIAWVTDYSNGADVVLSVPSIKSVRGLRGARVGLELGSLNTYLLARSLDTVGLSLTDVTLVNLASTELATAVRSGEVDAVVTYPPMSLELEKSLRMRPLFSSAEIPGEVLDVLSFDATVLAQRQADVRAMLRAYVRAAQYARDHPDEAYRIMATQAGLSVEEFKQAIEGGIELVYAKDQHQFFAANGPLEQAVAFTSKVLNDTRQLSAPVLAAGLLRSPGTL
ncbi:MAG: hypothetical protein FJY37_04245 [Betaproteobacteria bacterium]|nr:hypothetical protein [Betaproteobacteria bacterium]